MSEYIEGTLMRDAVEIIGANSIIQHGKHNDRIYLMKLAEEDKDTIISLLAKMALENKYSKIFCKIPKHVAPLFLAQGYLLEAYIPGFYNGSEDVFFVSKFLNSDRLLYVEKENIAQLSDLLSSDKKSKKIKSNGYTVRQLGKADVEALTNLYLEIFESYPFPIHNPGYILKTMQENVQYYGAFKDGELAAASSAEMDVKGQNAEMTDFATTASHKGNKLSALLLNFMEKEMKRQGIKTLYTIARVNSIPMNKTFLQSNYQYTGTLIKNTNIAGSIESMNIYYKSL